MQSYLRVSWTPLTDEQTAAIKAASSRAAAFAAFPHISKTQVRAVRNGLSHAQHRAARREMERRYTKTTRTARTVHRVLFVPDTHAPFHDPIAWKAFLAAAKEWRPHRLVIQGDFVDFHAVSAHAQNPTKARRIVDELANIHEMIADLQSIGASEVVYTEGNHEDRLRRYIWQNASALDGLLTVQALLKLPSNWQYIPYQQPFRIGKVLCVHDVGKCGLGAIRQSMAAVSGSVIMGHIHRAELVIKGNLGGGPHVGACFGWLGGPEADQDYSSISMRSSWSHGLGLGLYHRATEHLTVFPVPILNGKAIVPHVR